ncbi:MAG TPA: class I lanthipeptide [Chitinophaga sp.]|uniref:class I lanthipeptide n=1 Tax=Chitinophaga sp. TaxID=1869181 RepID=UPI002CC39ABA|nr:class I lanthipeptide [Chitinophaga sp.]HVI43814.1 class I lanthipeptide [Chitinophaga sp.]
MKKQTTKKIQLGKITIAALNQTEAAKERNNTWTTNTLYHSICPCTGGCPN